MKRYAAALNPPHPVRLPKGNLPVISVRRRPDEFGVVTLSDGTSDFATCLHCPDRPCVQFSDQEIDAEIGLQSNHYPAAETCVFGAMKWDAVANVPDIDSDLCVGCGVCVGRCPIGAIRLAESAEVRLEDSAALEESFDTAGVFEHFQAQLHTVSRRVCSDDATTAVMARAQDVLQALQASSDSGLSYRLLTRNLLLAIGISAKAAPPGNTNFRVELIFREQHGPTLAEVASRDATLDAIRRILADYAIVQNGRYGPPPNKVSAALVCAEFPNKRVGMYEVIGNIREYLQLEIHTIPLVMLLILCAYGSRLDGIDLEGRFLLSLQSKDVIADARELLGDCMPKVTHKYFGAGDL